MNYNMNFINLSDIGFEYAGVYIPPFAPNEPKPIEVSVTITEADTLLYAFNG